MCRLLTCCGELWVAFYIDPTLPELCPSSDVLRDQLLCCIVTQLDHCLQRLERNRQGVCATVERGADGPSEDDLLRLAGLDGEDRSDEL